MDNTRPIRHVNNLDPISSGIVSAPTKELEERIRILENALASFARKGTVSNIVLQERTIKSDVELYNTVFYNQASGLYEKALARVEFSGATFKSLPSSLVIGIVVKIVGSTADILVDGTWPAAIFKNNNTTSLLEPGETFQPGKPYYLSSDYAGRITFRPPALAVQVLLTSDDSLIMNKVYGSPEGFERAAKFKMGLRPVGDIKTLGNQTRIVGFDGLEASNSSGSWTKISSNSKFSKSNYMVADGEALGVSNDDLWVEFVVDTSGSITVGTASSLAQLASPDIRVEQFSNLQENVTDVPQAVNVTNYHDTRTYLVRDKNNTPINRISFKFVCNHGEEFDTDLHRSVIFKLPDSFMGWKEMNLEPPESGESSDKYQIRSYNADEYSDYPEYPHTPIDSTLYYATRADYGFVANWPAEPITKSIIMINGVETIATELEEAGESSYFGDKSYDMGVSTKTLYWPTSFSATAPWSASYQHIVEVGDSDVTSSAVITHRGASSGMNWCWLEDSYKYEPILNKGWVYTNKLSVYSKSTKVLGLGVMSPLRVRDMITGLEPTYEGEPIGGNLLVWSEDSDNVINKVQDVDLGRFSTQILYVNQTKFNVVVKDLTFVVRSQNNAQMSNLALGQVFTENDYALIDVGTGVTGSGVSNILYRAPVKVLEYNTSSTITITDGGAVIPPGGTVRLMVYKPFDVEQKVSIIFAGRTV